MDIVEKNLLIVKDDSKRVRKSNAIKLPPQINESMIPKYVVYYKECYNREKMLFREFFKIEKHPKITNKRVYTSSKSNKINILDKLEQIKTILENIENNFHEETKDDKEEKEEKEEEFDSFIGSKLKQYNINIPNKTRENLIHTFLYGCFLINYFLYE